MAGVISVTIAIISISVNEMRLLKETRVLPKGIASKKAEQIIRIVRKMQASHLLSLLSGLIFQLLFLRNPPPLVSRSMARNATRGKRRTFWVSLPKEKTAKTRMKRLMKRPRHAPRWRSRKVSRLRLLTVSSISSPRTRSCVGSPSESVDTQRKQTLLRRRRSLALLICRRTRAERDPRNPVSILASIMHLRRKQRTQRKGSRSKRSRARRNHMAIVKKLHPHLKSILSTPTLMALPK